MTWMTSHLTWAKRYLKGRSVDNPRQLDTVRTSTVSSCRRGKQTPTTISWVSRLRIGYLHVFLCSVVYLTEIVAACTAARVLLKRNHFAATSFSSFLPWINRRLAPRLKEDQRSNSIDPWIHFLGHAECRDGEFAPCLQEMAAVPLVSIAYWNRRNVTQQLRRKVNNQELRDITYK